MAHFELPGFSIGRRLEKSVTVSTTSASGHDDFVARLFQVAEQMATIAVADKRTSWNLDDRVLAAASEAIGALAVLAAGRSEVALM
jgi:hypothetical protein